MSKVYGKTLKTLLACPTAAWLSYGIFCLYISLSGRDLPAARDLHAVICVITSANARNYDAVRHNDGTYPAEMFGQAVLEINIELKQIDININSARWCKVAIEQVVAKISGQLLMWESAEKLEPQLQW